MPLRTAQRAAATDAVRCVRDPAFHALAVHRATAAPAAVFRGMSTCPRQAPADGRLERLKANGAAIVVARRHRRHPAAKEPTPQAAEAALLSDGVLLIRGVQRWTERPEEQCAERDHAPDDVGYAQEGR